MDEIDLKTRKMCISASLGLSLGAWFILSIIGEPGFLVKTIAACAAIAFLSYAFILWKEQTARITNRLIDSINELKEHKFVLLDIRHAAGIWAGTLDPSSVSRVQKLILIKRAIASNKLSTLTVDDRFAGPQDDWIITTSNFEKYLREIGEIKE